MANYVTTLKDMNDNNLLPKTTFKAIVDKNGDYISNDVVASDIDALKNDKINSLDTMQIIYGSPQLLTTASYQFSDNVTNYKKIVFFFKYASNGTHWTYIMYPEIDRGFHLYTAYGSTVHDAYGTVYDTYFHVDGKLGSDYVYLVNVYGFKTY